MKKKNKRLITLTLSLTLFSLGCLILIINLRDNLIFFYSPSEIIEKKIDTQKIIRVGGMVKEESLEKKIKFIDGKNLEEISFVITDFQKEIVISYIGILPDLFREGQGVVVEGVLKKQGFFHAKTVLAKHDENYMPPEIRNIKSINVEQK
tara:strand:- start:237 stop:686 length:450 start_codon:yes stop_codon:yes gene_type:complete